MGPDDDHPRPALLGDVDEALRGPIVDEHGLDDQVGREGSRSPGALAG